ASMKQIGSTQTESDVSLGIPANTVMAYSLIELYVKCNGQFELCLFSNNGGFEKVRSKDDIEEDGIMDLRGNFDANSHLNLNEGNNASGGTGQTEGHFQLLSVLPVAKRSSLLQLLKTTMEDREAVSVLECVLDQLCEGETPDLGDLEESERETVQAILDLVDQCVGKDEDVIRSSLLSAIHLIVSAMDGMTDEGLSMLGSCCSPPVLQALQILVQHVAAGSGRPSL
uniref:gasdermin-E-like n=1 Tax=Oncorhynchus gorbuscha TaxID=8017 RepID=UPI001EAEC926